MMKNMLFDRRKCLIKTAIGIFVFISFAGWRVLDAPAAEETIRGSGEPAREETIQVGEAPELEEAAQKDNIRVKLEIIGDWRIREEVEYYLTAIFGGIEDVDVVEDAPRIYIHIIARRITTNRGRVLGYVMASASSEVLRMMIDGNLPYVVTDYNGLWLETGPDLQVLSRQCAMAIDMGVFGKIRKKPGEEPEEGKSP